MGGSVIADCATSCDAASGTMEGGYIIVSSVGVARMALIAVTKL